MGLLKDHADCSPLACTGCRVEKKEQVCFTHVMFNACVLEKFADRLSWLLSKGTQEGIMFKLVN